AFTEISCSARRGRRSSSGRGQRRALFCRCPPLRQGGFVRLLELSVAPGDRGLRTQTVEILLAFPAKLLLADLVPDVPASFLERPKLRFRSRLEFQKLIS